MSPPTEPPALDPRLLELLACPLCPQRPPLRQVGDRLVCDACDHRYPVVDGIPHLLPESAEPDAPEPDAPEPDAPVPDVDQP